MSDPTTQVTSCLGAFVVLALNNSLVELPFCLFRACGFGMEH
jgi:hypothetical protein